MTLLIDGHNLIPHMYGMSLSDPDDEEKLIQVLQEYARLRKKRVEVYFDKAPAGQAGERRFGQIQAFFVREGSTADAAIMNRLRQLGKRSRNYVVVSSDRQVQQAARAMHASVLSSRAFAQEWENLTAEEPALDSRNRLLSDAEVDDWEQFFRRGRPSERKDD